VKRIRSRITYANVMSSIAVFLVLGGGAAYAARKIGANQLKANSVGTVKIKANAVTTRKIKKNAITTVKIRDNAVKNAKLDDGSVTTAKLANEAVTGAKINAASTPFARIVHEARGTSTVALTKGALTVYPLSNGVYTQEAGQDNTYIGALNVIIPESCTAPRRVVAAILVDAPKPTEATSSEYVASREFTDNGAGARGVQLAIGPGVSFQPSTATSRSLSLVAEAECGTGSGVTASFGGIDVTGIK